MAIKKKAPVSGIKAAPKRKRKVTRKSKPDDDSVIIFTSHRGHGGEWISVSGVKHMIDMPAVGEESDHVRLAIVLVKEPVNTDHPHMSHEALYDYETGFKIGYMRVAPGRDKTDAERIQISLQQIAYDKGIEEMLVDLDRHPLINH